MLFAAGRDGVPWYWCFFLPVYYHNLARHHGLPFFVAMPLSTLDRECASGAEIPIEERDQREVTHISGLGEDGSVITVQVTPQGSPAMNAAFDVTPARLVTGLITERGVCAASREGLRGLYPEPSDSAPGPASS